MKAALCKEEKNMLTGSLKRSEKKKWNQKFCIDERLNKKLEVK